MLVIGASGYLGSEVFRQAGARALGTYSSHPLASCQHYNFFTDALTPILARLEPNAPVVFAAAVERVQADSQIFLSALKRFVGEIARSKRRLVYVSSDAVFSGTKGQYSEDDTPDALSLYGQNLRYFEQEVAEQVANSLIVRVSYMYGDTDSHKDRRIIEARAALDSGQSFYRYDNIHKSPVPVVAAARMITSLARSDISGVLHIPGPRLSIFEFFTKELKSIGGLSGRVQACAAELAAGEGPDTSLVNNEESARVLRTLSYL